MGFSGAENLASCGPFLFYLANGILFFLLLRLQLMLLFFLLRVLGQVPAQFSFSLQKRKIEHL